MFVSVRGCIFIHIMIYVFIDMNMNLEAQQSTIIFAHIKSIIWFDKVIDYMYNVDVHHMI